MNKGLRATAGTLALIAASAWALSGQAKAQNAGDQGATNSQAGNAATPADQSTAQNGAAGAGALQEVVVTAERRATDIQQTPVVVTAIEGSQLQSQHLNVIQDLQTTVPGLQAWSTSGQFVNNEIRGLGTTQDTVSLALGVKTIIDGVVQDIVSGLDQAMYDMHDVEVLEGPQGTFVGASAIGGAIELNTEDPNFNGLGGYVLAGGGNYQDVKLQGAVNLPVSDTFAVRLAFNFEQEHSFYADIGDEANGFYYNSYSATNPASDGPPKLLLQNTIGAAYLIDPGAVDAHQLRVKALWKPSDNFESRTEFWYNTNSTGGLAQEPTPTTYQTLWAYPGAGATACTTVTGTTFNGSQLVCPGGGVTTHSTYYYPGEKPFQLDYYGTGWEYNDVSWQLNQELRYTLPDGIVLRSLSGFLHIINQEQDDLSFGPQDAGWNYHPNGPNYIPSEEIDLISPTTGKLTWIAGAYYEYRYAPIPDTSFSAPAPYQPYNLPTVLSTGAIGEAVNRDAAIFGQINWQFADTLQLQLGARENWDDNTSSNPYSQASAPGTILNEPNGSAHYSILYTTAACGAFTPPCYKVLSEESETGHYTDAVPTGKINLNWTPLPGQNFYLFYARGYSAGGVNQNSPDHTTFVPETVNDWETGWKGRVFNGHMLTQVGAYYERLQNYQYPIEDTEALGDTSTSTYIGNFAPSTIEGVSAAAQSRFGGLGVNFSVDYNRTVLGNVTTVNQGAFPAGFNSPLEHPQCLAGHTYIAPLECFDYTPYFTSVGGEAIPFAPLWQGFVAVDYLFHVGTGTLDPRVSYSYTTKQYGSIFESPYSELGSRSLWSASLEWVVGKWDTQIYGTNLSNQIYYVSNTGSGDVDYGAPRQVGVQATYHF